MNITETTPTTRPAEAKKYDLELLHPPDTINCIELL